MNVPATYRIEFGACMRELPVIEIIPGLSIAVLDLLGDPSLTEAAGECLARLVPADAEVLVMPEGKALALLHVVQRITGLPAVVPRKHRKSYMRAPVLEATAVSVTTQSPHAFFIGASDAAKLKGKRAVLLDDVVSSGGTYDALEILLAKAEALLAGKMAIATEGSPRADVIALAHLPLFKS